MGANLSKLFTHEGTGWTLACFEDFMRDPMETLLDQAWGNQGASNMLLELTPIHVAIYLGDTEKLKQLLSQSSDPNAGPMHITPLEFAVLCGNKQHVKILLDYISDINVIDTCLTLASIIGRVDMITLLLDNGADVNFNGMGALHEAIKYGQTKAVKYLVERGVDTEGKDREKSPLIAAIKFSRPDIVDILLDNKVDIERCVQNRSSALVTAACLGNEKIVLSLLDHRANVNVLCENKVNRISRLSGETLGNEYLANKRKITPIVAAAITNHPKVVRILIEHGAQLQFSTDVEFIDEIYLLGYNDVIKVFLEQKVNVNSRSPVGNLPIELAIRGNQIATVKLLLHLNKLTVDIDSNHLLHFACDKGFVKIAKLLIDHGADIKAANEYGESPIFLAASKGHVDIVRYLLQKGAVINACKGKQKCALFEAKIREYAEVVEVIKQSCGNCANDTAHYYKQNKTAEERKVLFTRQLTRVFQPHNLLFGFAVENGRIKFNTVDLSQFSLTKEETRALERNVLLWNGCLSIQLDQCVLEMCSTVDNFIANICERVTSHMKGILGFKLIRCGSTPARVKSGLPLENDYIFLINTRGSLEIEDIFELIKNEMAPGKMVKEAGILLQVQNITLGKVAICLELEVMTYKRGDATVPFSVDIVPARISANFEKQYFKASHQLNRFVRIALKRNELKNEGISSLNSNLISLISPKRDSTCDAGLYMHKLCKGLSAYHKQELRIAKFLVVSASRTEFDFSPLSHAETKLCTSFYVSLCFYTVLFNTYGTDREIRIPGKLAITVLKLLANAFEFFASCKQRDRSSILWFEHPFFANTSYPKHILFDKRIAKTLARDLERVIARFMQTKPDNARKTEHMFERAHTVYRPSDNFNVDPSPSEVLDLTEVSLQRYLVDADTIDSIDTLVNNQNHEQDNHIRDDCFNIDNINQCTNIDAKSKPDPCYDFGDMLGKLGKKKAKSKPDPCHDFEDMLGKLGSHNTKDKGNIHQKLHYFEMLPIITDLSELLRVFWQSLFDVSRGRPSWIEGVESSRLPIQDVMFTFMNNYTRAISELSGGNVPSRLELMFALVKEFGIAHSDSSGGNVPPFLDLFALLLEILVSVLSESSGENMPPLLDLCSTCKKSRKRPIRNKRWEFVSFSGLGVGVCACEKSLKRRIRTKESRGKRVEQDMIDDIDLD